MTRALDIVVNLWNREVTRNYPPELDQFWRLVKIEGVTLEGVTVEEELRQMDAAGIDKGLLVATTGGEVNSKIFFEKPFTECATLSLLRRRLTPRNPVGDAPVGD